MGLFKIILWKEKTIINRFKTIARHYIAKNYGNQFARHTKIYVLAKSTETNGIVEITRIDGETFYINILPKQDKVIHSGPYDKNRGINTITKLLNK